ncbi:MAG: hypothetical protein LBO65_09005 [Spirochaetaceae bacterium]|jgi:hypothetical protein|nr:hypothetical protein [Spirochaetaceae bacterium]
MVQKNSLPVFFVVLFVLSSPAESQETSSGGGDAGVFAPFVSQLEAEVRNNFIRLSWKDSLNVKGPVYVYRSESPLSRLSAGSLPAPVEIPYGTESCLDEADKPGTLYYFAAASDEWGRKYFLSIPYTNTISVLIGPENVPGYVLPGPGNTPEEKGSGPSGAGRGETPGIPGIEALSAQVEEGRIVIRFSGEDSKKNLILYRSINPIRNQGDLLSASIIQQRTTSPFIDSPPPGISYYYAAVYEEDLVAGFGSIRPGYNATTGGVEIPPHTRPAHSRTMPLPRINISGPRGSPDTPASVDLGPEAAGVVSSIGGGRRGPGPGNLEPAVFLEDLERDAAGEDYQLRSIVQGYFSLSQWEKAGAALRSFLELPRKVENQAKAHFYLGQVYYFQGKSREALFELLAAQDRYPVETKPWIQAVLGTFTGK